MKKINQNIEDTWDDEDMSVEDVNLTFQEFLLKNGNTVVVHSFNDFEENCLSVYATVDGELVAEGKFDPERQYFRGIEVKSEFRRQGIASAIYTYITDAGYEIRPSNNVLPDGLMFWATWNNRLPTPKIYYQKISRRI
jgi:Acetyltransferase (GNAT) family